MLNPGPRGVAQGSAPMAIARGLSFLKHVARAANVNPMPTRLKRRQLARHGCPSA